MTNNKKRFNHILNDIKKIKIQGARNIAKKALYAYSLIPTKETKKKLLSSRPTEPMMENVLDLAEKTGNYEKILAHFDEAQKKINESAFNVIKNNEVVFTHCHSTNVVNALIYSRQKRKNFQVYNTETRPLFQGRKTARELKRAGIKVTMFVDSASAFAIEKENRDDEIHADKVFLGADALLEGGIVNKIGSKTISELAYYNKIPVYIIADSWKFTEKKIPIEQRDLSEVWDKAPKSIKIKNPAFEFVPKKYIRGIITEFGLMGYNNFIKKMRP